MISRHLSHNIYVSLLTLLALLVTGPAAFPPDPAATCQNYKTDLLENCIDEHGMVCDRANGQLVGQNDAAWRTGILLLCLALEGDHENAAKVLTALENSWRDGRPVRHPADAHYQKNLAKDNLFSRDQFWPQLAALYYLHKHGTPELKDRARHLTARFVKVLDDHDWQLNTGPAASFTKNATHGRWVVYQAAKSMGLDGPWTGSNRISREIKRNEYKAYREAWIASIHAQAANCKLAMREKLDRDKNNPPQYHATFNKFMQLLIIYDVRRKTGGMTDAVNELARNCAARHNNAPILWLNGQEELADKVLAHWPEEWNKTDFVWQRNLDSQQRATANGSAAVDRPRLDYMLMYNLPKLNDAVKRGR